MNLIYFLPRYIGALKYYEKLFPALRARGMEPTFLLFEDVGMIAYCRERGLAYDARFALIPLGRTPLYSHVVREKQVFDQLDSFLGEAQPCCLVSEPSIPPRARALFSFAQKRRIPTFALQWAQNAGVARDSRRTLRSRALALTNHRDSFVIALLYKVYLGVLVVVIRTADLFLGGNHFVFKDRYTDRLGVIDESSRQLFLQEGWKDEEIRIVGSADFTIMHELRERVHRDATVREALLARYGLTEGRRKILVLSTPFYVGRGKAVFLDRRGQIEYFKRVLADIREVFPESETDILFKLHPRDEPIYDSLTPLGIKMFHNEANLEELVAVADLYIAHPTTAANFTIRASSTPAIFINFTPLSFFDEGKRIYHLRSITKTREEFRNQLAEYKRGTLPLQYDADVDINSLSTIADFITEKEIKGV